MLHTCRTYNFYIVKLCTQITWHFFTHMTLLSDIWGISTILKIEWNYKTQSSVHNHTSYIHQDILSWTGLHWLQQQIAYPTKYKLYNIYNYYVLKLSIKTHSDTQIITYTYSYMTYIHNILLISLLQNYTY